MLTESLTESAGARRLALLILVLAAVYQALLCLVHTQLFPVSRAMVGLAEVLLLLTCLPLLLPRLVPGVVIFVALSGALLCLLALFSGSLDVKIFRDLLLILWFYWLGRNLGDVALADRGLVTVTVLLLSFGLFELFALERFTGLFDIFSYYVNIGALQPVTDYVRDSRLQMNGIRPEDIGRTLLPGLLDNHRVSSLFLEPVSLGNYATILAAWGLARPLAQWRSMAFFTVMAIILIVLADSRFALVSVSLLMIMRVCLRGGWLYLTALLPLVLITLLVLIGLYADIPYSDSYAGRLMVSGRSLAGFSVQELLGVDPRAWYPDQGYAYVLSSFGLVLAVALWLAYWLAPVADGYGRYFQAFMAVYICLILCVSGTSVFALKTAAILWFLLGTLARDPARVSRPSPGEQTAGKAPASSLAGGRPVGFPRFPQPALRRGEVSL